MGYNAVTKGIGDIGQSPLHFLADRTMSDYSSIRSATVSIPNGRLTFKRGDRYTIKGHSPELNLEVLLTPEQANSFYSNFGSILTNWYGEIGYTRPEMRIIKTMDGEGLRARILGLFGKKGTTYELQSMGATDEGHIKVGLVFPEPKHKKRVGGYKIGLSDSPVNERVLNTAKAIAHDATIYFDIENPFLIKPGDTNDALDSCVAAVCAPPKQYSHPGLTDLIEQALKTPGTSVVLQGTNKGNSIYAAIKVELKPKGEAVGLSMKVAGTRNYKVVDISKDLLDYIPLDLESAVAKIEEYYRGRVRKTFNGVGEQLEELDYKLGSGMQSIGAGLKFLYMHSGLQKLGEWAYEQEFKLKEWSWQRQKNASNRGSHRASPLKNAWSRFLGAASVPLILIAEGASRFDEKLFGGIRESIGEFGDARRRADEEYQRMAAQRQEALLKRIQQLGIQPNENNPSCIVIANNDCL